MSLLGAYRVGSLFQNSAVLQRQECGFVTVKVRLYVRAVCRAVSVGSQRQGVAKNPCSCGTTGGDTLGGSQAVSMALDVRQHGSKTPCRWLWWNGIYRGQVTIEIIQSNSCHERRSISIFIGLNRHGNSTYKRKVLIPDRKVLIPKTKVLKEIT